MKKLDYTVPRGATDGAFVFLGTMGAMMHRGQGEQAETLAGLLAGAAKARRPVFEAREMATALRAFADVFDANPRFAAKMLGRVMEGPDATMQARFDMPPAPQPQRIAAAPKPRAP